MPLETAVVGAGVVSDHHLSALDACPQTTLVGICDVDRDRARDVADRYGIDAYTDVSALLDDRVLDWVHLCTPVQTHRDLAAQFIEAGVPVHIEKPITETVAEAEQLQRLSEQHGVPVSVTHQHLFDPAVRTARERVEQGALGEIRGADLIYTGETWPNMANRGEWAFELVGGEFEEGLPHPFYTMLGVVGYPASREQVSVQTSKHGEYDRGFAYDGVQVSYPTEDGALCSIECLAGSAPQKLLVVHGEDHSLTVDMVSQTVVDVGKNFNGSAIAKVRNNLSRATDRFVGTARNVLAVGRDRLDGDWESAKQLDSHYYQIDAEAAALLSGREMPVPLTEGVWTITLMECVREASREVETAVADA
jgi:predicted dehydrogenase